ncbi:MAG TPA: VWA domain-containing protein [Vicinamibacterales bacterium]
MMRRLLLVVVATIATGLVSVAAGPQAQPPSFKGTTRTVAVWATVTNSQGRLVPNLNREDFGVDDDGKRQDLTVFANELQPITVVMLLDRSGSMKPNLELEEKAAEAFVRSMAIEDKARIGSFAKYVQIDPVDFTSDHDVLFNILRNELQSDGPTPLWNAVDRGIDKLLVEQGRRVILVFTDGVDEPLNFSGKNKSLKDVMKRAEEQDVMVYAIGLAGQNGVHAGFGGRPETQQPDEGLPKIAAATGGGYFELTSARDLANTFLRVADELHHQYALGFTPEKLDGKMHDITVHLSRPDLRARARKRYLASKS